MNKIDSEIQKLLRKKELRKERRRFEEAAIELAESVKTVYDELPKRIEEKLRFEAKGEWLEARQADDRVHEIMTAMDLARVKVTSSCYG